MSELALRLSTAVEALIDPPDEKSAGFLQGFDAFARELLPEPRGASLERTGLFPERELEAFAERGLIEVFAPGTADWSRAVSTALRFSAYEPDVLLCLGGTALGTLPILVAGNDVQKATLTRVLRSGKMAGFGLSEWNHGLDVLGNAASATQLEDGKFRLSGTKAPVNNATRGAIVTVLVRTSEGREANSQSLFMVEREKTPLAPGKSFDSLGYRSMDSSSIVLDGVTLPASALLGKVGEGFHHARRSLEISRGGVSAMAAGLSVRAFALAVAHAEERVLYDAKVSEIPAVRTLLAQSFARMLEGVALARFTARLIAHATVSSRHATCAAKMVIPELLEENVHACGTVLGARSLLEELPFARLRRTAPVYAVFDGSTLLQKEELWRSLITWRMPGTLTEDAVRERFAALTAPSPPFNPYGDDSELAEALTPPAVLAITSDLLNLPLLSELSVAAAALVEGAPMLRRALPEAKHAASEAAGALYAMTALALFAAQAPEMARTTLVPVVQLRGAVALGAVARTFAVLDWPWPGGTPPSALSTVQKTAATTAPVTAVMNNLLGRVSSQ